MEASDIQRRCSRAKSSQLNAMVDFFYENIGLAEGRYQALYGKVAYKKKWEEMTEVLNAIDGAYKRVTQWQVVWRDLKSRTLIKARERKKELTELELRIVNLVGTDYVQESKEFPDSIPDEDEFQSTFEDEDVLLCSAPVAHSYDETFEENELQSVFEKEDEDVLLRFPAEANISQETQSEAENTKYITSTSKRLKKDHVKKRKFCSRKRRRREDHTSETFLKIARQQAEAIEILAESSKISAEAAVSTAQSLQRIAASLQKLISSINKR